MTRRTVGTKITGNTGNTEMTMFGGLVEGFPSIAEQREIEAHNAPIIESLSVAVLQAQRLFGIDTPEHVAACRIFDAAVSATGKL